MFKYLMYQIGKFLSTHLSLALSYKLAILLSDIHYYFSFRDRKAVKENLKQILSSEKHLSSQIKQVFRNFGKYLNEFFRMENKVDKDFIKKNVKLENFHYLDDVLKKGKGCILLSAHLGNWELGAAVVSLLGYPVLVIALPHKERPVNNLFNCQREANGITVVPTNASVRRYVEALKDNQIVAIVGDRDFSAKGEKVKFFGKETLIPKGPAILSERTGAPIVPIFLTRSDDYKFTLHLDTPIYSPGVTSGDIIARETLLSVINQYVSVIEERIRQYPTQWLMFRRFWINGKNISST